jgi:two-component system, NtrC family, nitrogen regulation sensor histidine kinase NtrY
MPNKFFNRFKDDRKYFAIVLFILFLLLISGFITPLLVDQKKENWSEELSRRISEIETSVVSIYKEKEHNLLNISAGIKAQLHEALKPGNNSYGTLIEILNSEEYDKYSLEIFAPNGRLIAWNNNIAYPQEDVFPLAAPAGEVHFNSTDLITYLSVIDTLLVESDLFYFAASLMIEKQYEFQNPYYKEVSFSKEISEKFLTQFEAAYNPFEPATKDGRKHSFEILNNKNVKIGQITFLKPSLTTALNSLQETSTKIQSLLVAAACFFAGFGFRRDFKELRWRSIRLAVFIAYLILFRALLYIVDFPANFIEGSIKDPAYFSSAFGWGIVKTPLEFLISVIFILIISILCYRYLMNYLRESKAHREKISFIFFIISPAALLLFFILLRGLNAAVKSVIFDSTLRYFKELSVIPTFPALVMNLNVLLLGLSVVLLLTSIILYASSLLPNKDKKIFKKSFILFFTAAQIFGLMFILFQAEPLTTVLINIFFTAIIFFFVYQIHHTKRNTIFTYVYASIVASVMTITLLNYFNLHIEREALKTTAYELNRPNENLLRFLINRTLTAESSGNNVNEIFARRNTNFTAAAFKMWSRSPLQRESMISSITIYGKNRELLGKFGVGIDDNLTALQKFPAVTDEEPNIIEFDHPEEPNNKIFMGAIAVKERGILLGYISAAVIYDLQTFASGIIPEFIQSRKNIINSAIDLRELKIFDFREGKLLNVYGDIYPSREQTEPIINAEFSEANETWLTITLNNEDYITYSLRSGSGEDEKITSVLLREKHFTWNLFNFFKIFIVHSIFILIFLLIIFLVNVKRIKLTFRSQLLIAFLIISILPVMLLAVYNRELITSRSESAIFSELNERGEYVENHIRAQKQKHPGRDLLVIFNNAAKELGVAFGVYEGTNLIYHSKNDFYDAGFFSSKLNSEIHYMLNYLSYREFIAKEKIEDFVYDSFYKKITIDNRTFIIGVNDAFNKVNLSLSSIDVDVFLFGVYSFAAIIIIIISSLLANRISEPIRRLTKATESVAQGDLNVQLEHKERGEIKELIEGFNSMTRELQKNQLELAELERENAWKEMAKQVAHEIKNPLTPMKLAVQQMIISYKDKTRNFENILEKISSTLLSQIDNLSQIASEFSRFAKMPTINLEIIDLTAIVSDTANLFTDEKIKIDIDTELISAEVEADKSQLRRLFINLIRNSIQANAKSIAITLNKIDDKYEVLFSDNGEGIPETLQEKIFDSNFTTKEKGMGIGLKLAKRFLEGVNGNILLVSSSPGRTTFKILIPAHS